jgi:hypothetical protein
MVLVQVVEVDTTAAVAAELVVLVLVERVVHHF